VRFCRPIVIYLPLLIAGCALPPKAGDIVHANVVLVVPEKTFEYVRANPKDALRNDPYKAQEILYAIAQGVTLADIRNRRLLMLSCRYGSNSGEHFMVLLPEGIEIGHGPRVELELEAGIPSTETRPGTFSKFLRVLPHRERGRTNCNPAGNSLQERF
jgi:hypothetical protein